jgi:glycosyltransferase involved in cell wall biosynthesis
MKKTKPSPAIKPGMRVLLISPWIKLGGSEGLVLRTARLLMARGCQVSVACCFVDPSLIEDQIAGIDFIQPWRWITSLSRRSRIALSLVGCPGLLVTVLRRARGFDLINPHNFPSLWIAACAARISGAWIVWHFNEPAPIGGPLNLIERAASRQAARITVLDEPSRAQVHRRFQRESILVRPGVDFDFWSQEVARDELAGPATLLTVGKLHPQKNQVMLINAVHALAGELKELRLIIAGDGPDRRRLERRVDELGLRERVWFSGMVDAATLRVFYRSAFLVCFPALHQTWGLTPFEALCQKTVSIVSSQAGAAEVIEAERIGLVAQPELDTFVTTIRWAYRVPEEVRETGKRGFDFVQDKMTWDRFGDEMLDVFRPLPSHQLNAA